MSAMMKIMGGKTLLLKGKKDGLIIPPSDGEGRIQPTQPRRCRGRVFIMKYAFSPWQGLEFRRE
jgi:hypothetical protein